MSSTKVALPNRMNFGKVKHLAATPDLLEIQIQSFKDYFQLETTPDKRNNEGLFKVFKENFPITDTRNIFVLEFLDYFIDPPRYTIEECMERGLTYAVPLKAKLRLSCNDEEHVDFQTIVQDVFLGNIPYMYLNCIVLLEYSSDNRYIQTVPKYILPGLFLSKEPGWNLLQISIT
jgi:DNA-directed RNA polymerase subunit beta